MTILAQQIADRARIIIQDPDKTRFTDAEALTWLNEGRRAVAGIKPQVFGASSELTHTTVAGCKQRLTDGTAFRLDSVDYNVTSGKAIRVATKVQLDAFRPDWRSDEAADDAQNWFPDSVDPLAFYLYPAVGSGKSIKVHAYLTPAELASLAAVALPFDQYEVALTHYVVARFYSKDAEYGGNAQLAQSYLQLFTAALA